MSQRGSTAASESTDIRHTQNTLTAAADAQTPVGMPPADKAASLAAGSPAGPAEQSPYARTGNPADIRPRTAIPFVTGGTLLPGDAWSMRQATNANICELPGKTPTADEAPITLRAVSIARAIADMCDVSANRIFRIQFAGFDRAAYQAMEDTLILASQEVRERFVPIDPVSLALGAKPNVVVINLGHPDATQLGKTLRPGPGVPVVWVSFAEGNPEVAKPGTAVFNSLLKAMQEVVAQRAAGPDAAGGVGQLAV